MKRQAHETSSRTGPAHLSILFTFISMLYKSLLLINNNKLHTNNLTNYATITILAAYSLYQSQVATNHYYSLDLHTISVRNKTTTNFVSLLLYILIMCMMSVILLSIHINRDCLISMCLSSNINFFVINFKTFFVNLLALTTALTTTNALITGILSTVITSKLISKLQALTASNCTQGSHFTAICSRVTNVYYQIISILTMCLMTCILSSHANLANHTTTTAVWMSSTTINLQLVVFTWLIYSIATINNMRLSSAFTAASMKSLFKNTNSTLSQRCSLSLAVTSGPLQQSLTITRLTAITWNALRLFLSSSAIFLHNIIRIICCYIYTNTSIPNLLSLLVSISIIRSVYSHFFLLGIIILPVYSVTTTCLLMSVILTTSAIIHSLYSWYSQATPLHSLWQLPCTNLCHYIKDLSGSTTFTYSSITTIHTTLRSSYNCIMLLTNANCRRSLPRLPISHTLLYTLNTCTNISNMLLGPLYITLKSYCCHTHTVTDTIAKIVYWVHFIIITLLSLLTGDKHTTLFTPSQYVYQLTMHGYKPK